MAQQRYSARRAAKCGHADYRDYWTHGIYCAMCMECGEVLATGELTEDRMREVQWVHPKFRLPTFARPTLRIVK